jgi:hypothetical protein
VLKNATKAAHVFKGAAKAASVVAFFMAPTGLD